MQMKPIASLLFLAVVSTAYAKPSPKRLYSSGDWTLEDTDKKNPEALCVAYTTAEYGRTIYRLEFAHSKKLPGPTEVLIRIQGTPGASSYTIKLKDESVLAFPSAGEVAKNQSLLWNIPQHTGSLIAQLEDRRDLRLSPADGSRDQRLEFSSDGFKRVKEKMQEKCLQNQPAYDLAFEEAFILKRDEINPLGMTPEQVAELRRVLNAGYAVHLGIKGTQDDLIKLRAKFQNQLNERESLNNRIADLANREIPAIIQAQQNNDALEASSRAQLQQVTVTIGQQQNSLNAAQSQLNAARNILAPYEAEHAQREASARSARSSANQSAARLSDIDNGLRSADARIRGLSNEAGSLQNANARLESDLRYARQNRLRAEADARSFRPQEERMRRLQSDPLYQGARRELPSLQNNVRIAESALNDGKGKLVARETELRVCQTRTSFIEKSSMERIPAQERPRGPNYNPNPGDRPGRPGQGDRPERPGRPGNTQPTPTQPAPTQPDQPAPSQPTQPTTPTQPDVSTPDCTSQQNAVNQAKLVVTNLENQLRAARDRQSDVERKMDQIERRVSMEVDRIKDELNARAISAMRQEDNLNSQLGVNIRRLEVIANVEIPQQQNIINALQNERPSVQARYNQDAPLASRLESELAAFERRVGWDAKVQAVNTAENLVAQRSNELNNSLSQKASLESQIGRCQQSRTSLAAQLVDSQNRKVQAENRLAQVLQSLAPFENERARLEQQQGDLQNQLAATAQDFESKLQ